MLDIYSLVEVSPVRLWPGVILTSPRDCRDVSDVTSHVPGVLTSCLLPPSSWQPPLHLRLLTQYFRVKTRGNLSSTGSTHRHRHQANIKFVNYVRFWNHTLLLTLCTKLRRCAFFHIFGHKPFYILLEYDMFLIKGRLKMDIYKHNFIISTSCSK